LNRHRLLKVPGGVSKKRLDETSEDDIHVLFEDSTVFEDENGKPLIVYVEDALDLNKLSFMLKSVEYDQTSRTGGMKTISRVFGYQPRITIRRDFCTEASFNTDYPKAYEEIIRSGIEASFQYAKHNPEIYEEHLKRIVGLKGEYVIPNTPFTSGIINKNNQLRYHYDSGNIKGVWSNMIVMKKNVEGGYLSLPEYGVGMRLANNSIFLFDGQSILHGVTPIKMLNPDSYRISVVYYSLQGMWKCLGAEEELKRIRSVKTERELKRA